MSTAPVWAIVLNWNGWEDTQRCVDSLRSQDYPSLHVLIVDNGSTDGSPERLREACPDTALKVLPENLGFAGGMNRGIEAAMEQGAAFVLLMNNDATLAPDAVSRLVAAAAAEDAAMAVPTIHYAEPRNEAWYAGGALSPWTGTAHHWSAPRVDAPHEVSFATGCCMLIRTAILPRVGLLNERYFLYFEDLEFCHRLLAEGHRILYVPEALAWHAVGASTGSQRQKAPALDYYDVRNGLFYMTEQLRGLQLLSALAYFMGARLPRKVVRILLKSPRKSESLRAVARGLWDAIRRQGGAMPRPPHPIKTGRVAT